MELSELFESLSFLLSSSSVLFWDRGFGGLLGAPPSPAALGLRAGRGGPWVCAAPAPGRCTTASSWVRRQDISRGSSPSRRQLLPPMGSSAELKYTREMDLV